MITHPAGPLPSLEEPFALMRACHRRVEQRMGLLRGLAGRLRDPEPAARAEALVLLEGIHAFMATVGVHHTGDEEEGLYPMLRETGDPECIRILDELEQEHMRLEPILVAFDRKAGRIVADERLDEASVTELEHLITTMVDLYQAHIRHEEGVLYPRAEALLTPEQVKELSRGMRERRGLVSGPGATRSLG